MDRPSPATQSMSIECNVRARSGQRQDTAYAPERNALSVCDSLESQMTDDATIKVKCEVPITSAKNSSSTSDCRRGVRRHTAVRRLEGDGWPRVCGAGPGAFGSLPSESARPPRKSRPQHEGAACNEPCQADHSTTCANASCGTGMGEEGETRPRLTLGAATSADTHRTSSAAIALASR